MPLALGLLRFGFGRRALRCGGTSASLLDLCHFDPRQLLTVTGGALVAALGLVLEDANLLAAQVLDDLCLDADLGERRGVEYGVI